MYGLHDIIRNSKGHNYQKRSTYTSLWTSKVHSETFIITTHMSCNFSENLARPVFVQPSEAWLVRKLGKKDIIGIG